MTQVKDTSEANILSRDTSVAQQNTEYMARSAQVGARQMQDIKRLGEELGPLPPLPDLEITGASHSERANSTISKSRKAIEVSHNPAFKKHVSKDFSAVENKKKPTPEIKPSANAGQPGILLVAKEIGIGAEDELTHHIDRVAGNVISGLVTGAAIAVIAPIVAPEALVFIGVAGACIAGYELYENAGGWYHDADVVSHESKFSLADISEAQTKLKKFGAGAVDYAAVSVGAGLSCSTKTALGRNYREGAASSASRVLDIFGKPAVHAAEHGSWSATFATYGALMRKNYAG